MSDVLTEICATTRERIARAKAARPLAAVEKAAAAAPAAARLSPSARRARCAPGGYGLIAEIKKASPSAGLIRPDFDPAALARAYQHGGAACLSVLTDEALFPGRAARSRRGARGRRLAGAAQGLHARPLPGGRSARAGRRLHPADHGGARRTTRRRELERAAAAWRLDVLAEVHDAASSTARSRSKTRLIGINNRNLKTLKTDLATTETLVRAACRATAAGRAKAASSRPPTSPAWRAPACARFLIGEALMRQADVAAATRALLATEPAQP